MNDQFKYFDQFVHALVDMNLPLAEEKTICDIFRKAVECDYTHIRLVDGAVCGIQRMIYTYAVCIDIDKFGCYEHRYCYETLEAALAVYDTWTGETELTGYTRKI